ALLHAELLERTGNYSRARSIVESALKAKNLSPANRSICESILGLVAMQDGDLDDSMIHLQRAATLAGEAGCLERACWSRLRFLLLLSDRSGPDAILTHLPDLRSNVLRAGTSHLLAALHIFVGQMEGKRGLLRSAHHHCRLGQELLSRTPNLWLEATSE